MGLQQSLRQCTAAYYYDAVLWASQNGIVYGYGNALFGQDDEITREQFATMLHRYAQHDGLDTSNSGYASQYADEGRVSTWAQDAMKWANANGLITGRTPTTLVPQGTATRAEAATILMRFMLNND